MRYAKESKTMSKQEERRITVLEQQAKSVLEVLQRIDERTEHLDHIIRGNGHPGLVTRVEVMEVEADELKVKVANAETAQKEAVKSKSDHLWQWWIAIGSLALIEVGHWLLAK